MTAINGRCQKTGWVSWRAILLPLCFVIATLCLSAPADAQKPVGYVLTSEGGWYLEGRSQQRLSPAERLPARGVIRIQNPSRYDFIQIAFYDGGVLTRRCRNRGECDQPILLPDAAQEERGGAWAYILDRAMSVLRRDRGRPSVYMSRTVDGSLQEAVLKIKGGRADLAPAFRHMVKGVYQARLERRALPGAPAEGAAGAPVTLTWVPSPTARLWSTPVRQGLHVITLLGRDSTTFIEPRPAAWVLVVEEKRYPRVAASFSAAVRLTERWGEPVDEGAKREFLQAFLAHLAAEGRPAKRAKK